MQPLWTEQTCLNFFKHHSTMSFLMFHLPNSIYLHCSKTFGQIRLLFTCHIFKLSELSITFSSPMNSPPSTPLLLSLSMPIHGWQWSSINERSKSNNTVTHYHTSAGHGRWFGHSLPKYQSLWFSTRPITCQIHHQLETRKDPLYCIYYISTIRYHQINYFIWNTTSYSKQLQQ